MPIQAGQPIKASEVNAAFDAKENLSNKVTSISSASTDTQYPSAKAVYAHTSRTDNPHAVTAAQVGLGNVDNTSDAGKPISIAVQTALTAVQTALSNLSFFPVGTILTFSTAAYNRTSAAFKTIWKICDGQNGTPNLMGRFLRGDSASGSTGGGVATLTAANLPAHTHTVSGTAQNVILNGSFSVSLYRNTTFSGIVSRSGELYAHCEDGDNSSGNRDVLMIDASHSHSLFGMAEANTAHRANPFNVVPAYYTVIYVMRVA